MKQPENVYSEFFNALLEGDRNTCSKIIHAQIDNGREIKDLYEKIIKKSLYEIGELWEYNKISVATEHLASAIVEAILNELYTGIVAKETVAGKVIIACVENEYHQIGIKMVSDIFEANGWAVYYLGSNTPTQDLIEFAKKIQPDIMALSMSIYFHMPALEMMIQKIREEWTDIPILLGGQSFSRGGMEIIKKYNNVIYFSDLFSLDKHIKQLK